MRLYVIGPVTGRENLNRAAFKAAKEKLEQAGYAVTIPHDIIPPDVSHEDAMRMSIGWITRLDRGGVAALAGWDESRGAKLEREVAVARGLEIHCVDTWLRMADDSPENDNSPKGTPNPPSPPSDGVTAPSNEALSALTRRMDETNALLRAACGQISVLTALMGMYMLNKGDFSERLLTEALEKAAQLSEEAGVPYRKPDGEENQDGRA